MSEMNMPGFNAEHSLYKSTKGYVVGLNRATARGGAVVPAQRLMDAPPTVYEPTPTPGVVFFMKKVCWDKTTNTSKFFGIYFQTDCQTCQWFKNSLICNQPPTCHWGWVPVGESFQECDSSVVGID